ncbi:hypothetical protein [Marinobacter sp. KMM 10035]|uniref:hypothetical protein n=1 Tax=Marinobacter sp. KMM 10035 TaxID=3134034 RepID=UPI003978FCF1
MIAYRPSEYEIKPSAFETSQIPNCFETSALTVGTTKLEVAIRLAATENLTSKNSCQYRFQEGFGLMFSFARENIYTGASYDFGKFGLGADYSVTDDGNTNKDTTLFNVAATVDVTSTTGSEKCQRFRRNC